MKATKRLITIRAKKGKMYHHLFDNPPFTSPGVRRIGATVYSAFWRGYDGICPYSIISYTPAAEAWRAGQDRRVLDEKVRAAV